MTVTKPMATVRDNFTSMLDRIEREHDRVVITRRGRPAAMLVSLDDIEGLEETIALLSDSTAMAEIRSAQEEIDSGNAVSGEEFLARYRRTE